MLVPPRPCERLLDRLVMPDIMPVAGAGRHRVTTLTMRAGSRESSGGAVGAVVIPWCGDDRDHPHSARTGRRRQARPRRAAGRRGGGARRDHVDPRHHGRVRRPADVPGRLRRLSGRGRVDHDRLHAGPGHGDPAQRLGGRPVRHQAALHARGAAVHRRLGALRHRDQHRDARGVPGAPGARRRHADAGRDDDHDPRRRPRPGRPGDGGPRRPDAARPDLRPDPRWLADRHRELALDLPHQRPDRCRRPALRRQGAAARRRAAVGDVRLPRHAAALAGARAVPLRRLLDPGRRHRLGGPGAGLGGRSGWS